MVNHYHIFYVGIRDLTEMEGRQKEKIIRVFGRNLKRARQSKKLSLRKLAAEADMEHKHIERIEKGVVNPTLTTIMVLAAALEMDPRDLLP